MFLFFTLALHPFPLKGKGAQAWRAGQFRTLAAYAGLSLSL